MSSLSNQPGARPPPPVTGDAPTMPVASPSHVPGSFDANAPFWLPDWPESLRLLGWRWIFVFAIAAVFAGTGWLVIFRGRMLVLSFSGLLIKALMIAIGASISMWVYLRRGVVRLRKDPFCIHCGYSLTGLADGGTCPECGRAYSFRVAEEYKRDPHWFIERYRTRGHVASTGGTLEVPVAARSNRQHTGL